jgi:YD repeat-containing protein
MTKRTRAFCRGQAALLIIGCVFWSASAAAASPTVLIASAPLVDPSTALTTYGSPASPASNTTRDPVIQETSRSLKYNVDLIYEYVRDNVQTLPMFGTLKGARGVVIDGYGTPFDQAQFMVEALREADAVAGTGYNAQYILGKITLSSSDFSAWTGIADAATAAKYLANAGVPATVSGSGTSFTVTMLHIWVQASIGGTAYVFDPSYKPSTQQAGLSWQAATGYTKADLLTAGVTGTSTSVSGFGVTAFRNKLAGYRTNLENFIAANAAGKRADVVVGTSRIVAHPSSDNRRTTLPYAISSDRTWAGEIPSVFRTSFTVSLNGTAYGTYYADQTGGKVLGFSYSGSGSTFTAGSELPQPILSGSFLNQCDSWLGSQPAATATVSIAINHPYVAVNSTYGDRTISRTVARQLCSGGVFYVSNDWGYVGDGITRRMAPAATLLRADPQRKTDFIFAPTVANVASQYSALLDLAGHAQGNVYELHDLIGIHVIDNAALQLNPPGNNDQHAFVSMSFEAAVSAFSPQGTTSGDTTAAYTAGLGLSIAEASAPRQETDAVYDMAALSLVTQQDSRASPGGPYTTYLATPQTWNNTKNSLSEYPVAACCAAGSAIPTYVSTEGYTVLVPQKGALRQPQITVSSLVTRTSSLWEGPEFSGTASGPELKRSAWLAFRPSGVAGSAPDRITISMYDSRRGSVIKAGVGVATATGSTNDPIRRPDAPKAEGKDLFRSELNVDPRTGAVTYSPPADLKDGAGDFPQSLELRRVYDPRDLTNYGFGIGWKSNWYQVATLSNDGQAALGRSGAMGVASALVTLQAMGDLVTTQDAKNLYAALQVAAWYTDQTINNTILVSRGLDSPETFYRRTDGTYASGRPDGSMLTLSGTPSTGIINRRLYISQIANYTDGAGTVRNYASVGNSAGRDLSSPGIAQLFTNKSLELNTWNFPNGINVTTAYNSLGAAPDIRALYRVTNNVGAAIYQPSGGYDFGSQNDVPVCGPGGVVQYDPPRPAYIKYNTEAAGVTFNMDAQVYWTISGDPDTARCPAGSTTPPAYQTEVISGLNSMVDTTARTWAYTYASVPGLFGRTTSLSGLFKPSSPSTADTQIAYGQDTHARTITDANSQVWNYYSSPFRSEVISPLQAPVNVGSVTYFDRYAQAIRSVNALGQMTTTLYDDFGRPTEVTHPEGDKTITAYDIRGNVTSETKRAKPGSLLSDLVTTTTYVTGPTTASCATPATCNKPLSVKDPRGFYSNYSWDNSSGNLLSVTQGLDVNGTCQLIGGSCPQTSYTYTSLPGYDGFQGTLGTLSLPATKQVLISVGNSTTSSYNWLLKDFSPAQYTGMSNLSVKKVQANGIVTDSAGLNLRTCFLSDSSGNVIAVTEPKAGLGTCP